LSRLSCSAASSSALAFSIGSIWSAVPIVSPARSGDVYVA
jgi:hypothetical protein